MKRHAKRGRMCKGVKSALYSWCGYKKMISKKTGLYTYCQVGSVKLEVFGDDAQDTA